MNTTPTQSSRNRDYLKKALVPLLAVVLGIILYLQRSTGSQDSQLPDSPSDSVSRPSNYPSDAMASNQETLWPQFDLDEIAATSPFGRPPIKATPIETTVAQPTPHTTGITSESPDPSRPDPQSRPIQKLRNDSLQAILRTGNGYAALVNSKIVRAGDILDGNMRVVEINSQGVLVERLALPSSDTDD